MTETGNRHEMKRQEFCLGTRSFNLFLDCQGSQTLEKAVGSPPPEMLKQSPHSLLEVTSFSKGWTPQEPSSLIHAESRTNNSSQITGLLMCDLYYSLLEIKDSSCKHLKSGLDRGIHPLIKRCRENFVFPVYSSST